MTPTLKGAMQAYGHSSSGPEALTGVALTEDGRGCIRLLIYSVLLTEFAYDRRANINC